MRTAIRILTLATMIFSPAVGQTAQTPYAGQEKREIKALSEDEIQAYQNGQGMGFAKAAELNQFPGPKHVLELASQLSLTDREKKETQRIYDRMHSDATRLGGLIVAKERELDELFNDKSIDPIKLRATVAEIARLQGELRVVHLQAHLDMRRLLSPDQIKKYDQLRGYQSGGNERKHHERKH